MLIWSLINCVVPVIPAIIIWVGFWISPKTRNFKPIETATAILGDGQLFFYSISLCAATISDLLPKIENTKADRIFVDIILLIVTIIGVSIFYGQIIRIKIEKENDKTILLKTSLISFFISIVTTVYVLIARNSGGLFE